MGTWWGQASDLTLAIDLHFSFFFFSPATRVMPAPRLLTWAVSKHLAFPGKPEAQAPRWWDPNADTTRPVREET